jgi:hypothetical protein
MTEDPEIPGADEQETVAPETERLRTGVAAVDEVIAAVEQLEERPIEEHVGVFETAHEQLRRALDSLPSAPAEPSSDPS